MSKHTFFLFVAAAMLVVTPSCKRYETVPGDAQQTKIYTLDNGMKIFMSVNKVSPMAFWRDQYFQRLEY